MIFITYLLLHVKSVESVKVAAVSESLQPHTVHGILQARILKWVVFPFSRRSSQPRYKPRSPMVQADSLPATPQGKPKNTGVDSLSLLQQIFLTQELNQGLLHCRCILYQQPIREAHTGTPKLSCLEQHIDYLTISVVQVSWHRNRNSTN